MEFTKDIYFNDSLKNGNKATITYSGELFKSGSEHVNIVYGFGENWHNTTTSPMEKTENGFVANIDMIDFDTFNFCFSNEHNIWDNNNSFNYISPILPKIDEITLDDDIDFGSDYSSSIDDIIEDILGNTVQNSIANNNEADSVNKILESISEETLPEVEELFDELFSAEFEYKTPIVQIQEENSNIQENIVVNSESDDTNAELIRLFNELFDSANDNITLETNEISENVAEQSTTQENKLNVASFNLDGLVSELLEPVITKTVSNYDSEISLFDDIKEHENDEEMSLTIVDSKDLLVSSRKLSSLYKLKKKIKLAFYKLFIKIPKQIAKQFGFNEN